MPWDAQGCCELGGVPSAGGQAAAYRRHAVTSALSGVSLGGLAPAWARTPPCLTSGTSGTSGTSAASASASASRTRWTR